jgi:hypothetical protein
VEVAYQPGSRWANKHKRTNSAVLDNSSGGFDELWVWLAICADRTLGFTISADPERDYSVRSDEAVLVARG